MKQAIGEGINRALPHNLPQYVKVVRSKGHTYYYFDTGRRDNGKKVYTRLPDLRDPKFGGALAACQGHRKRGGVTAIVRTPVLIDLYQKSASYKALKPNSRKLYDIGLAKLEKLLPTAPVAEITTVDMQRLFDGMAETPGAANSFLGVCGALFKWAKPRGYIVHNPIVGIVPLKMGEHQPWPKSVLEAALASDDNTVRLLTHLLYFTAQRINDVLSMRWSDIENGRLIVRQDKTDKLLSIPLHQRLADELARTPRRGLLIATTARERRFDEDTARNILKAFCQEHGVKRVPHGLRKNAVNALLECGCTVPETAAISGQSLQMVEHYAKERDRSVMADAAVLKWQGTGGERSNRGKPSRAVGEKNVDLG